MSLNERHYQLKLVRKLEQLLPGCVIIKNDPRGIQGMPDILILYLNTWAALEIKMAGNSAVQPNQEYYIDLLDDMSFASFINPENEEEVLGDLQHAFGVIRETRIS
jgi:hypothetical protein